MRSIELGRWPRAIECIELFPAPRGKYSGLLNSQTLNNCILSNSLLSCKFIISGNPYLQVDHCMNNYPTFVTVQLTLANGFVSEGLGKLQQI